MPTTSQIAPPFATGSGGPSFEFQVQAAFLASMLVKARCPCATTGEIISLRLQAKEAGANTDDILAVVRSEDGAQFRLLGQIKHGITFTATNEAFKDTIHAAWADYHAEGLQRGVDKIVIISGPQSRKVIDHVRPLLDWARGCASAQEFYGKARREKFSSQQRKDFLDALGKVLFDGPIPSEQEGAVWEFLKALYLLQYDFDSQQSQNEVLVLSLLELAKSPACQESAQGLWAQLVLLVQEFNREAATVTQEVLGARLTPVLREAFAVASSPAAGVLVEKLREHTQLNLEDISSEVFPSIHIHRSELEDELLGLLAEHRIVVLTGKAGTGKSALAKDSIARLILHAPVFLFKAKEFQYPNLHQFLNGFLTNQTFAHLSSRLALFSPKILWIESAEQLLELNPSDAFAQLLREIKDDESWRVVLTCREEALFEVLQAFLVPLRLDSQFMRVPELAANELASVTTRLPQLAGYVQDPRLARVLCNPFYLHLACSPLPPFRHQAANQSLTVTEFQRALCRRAVEKPSTRRGRLNVRRYHTFIDLCVQRARAMAVRVPSGDYDQEAVTALVGDGLLTEDDQHCVAPYHDLFEDWALGEFIEREFKTAGHRDQFRDCVGPQPAMRRAFRKWLVSALDTPDTSRIADFVANVALDSSQPGYWRDDALVGILLSEKADLFFSAARSALLAKQSPLLQRVMHLLHVACKGPNQRLLGSLGLTSQNAPGAIQALFTQPIGGGWGAFFSFLRQYWSNLSKAMRYRSLSLLSEWATNFDQSQAPDQIARDCAELALSLFMESSQGPGYFRDGQKAAEVAITLCNAISDQLRQMYLMLLKLEDDEDMISDPLVEAVFKTPTTMHLSRVLPDVVIAMVEKYAFLNNASHQDWHEKYDIESRYGLNSDARLDHYPASALYGPFWYLLGSHPQQAVPFIIRFLNRAVAELVRRETGYEESKVTLRLNDGSERQIYCSIKLWCMYRASQNGPKLMESALMALEKWLLDSSKTGADVRWAIDHILLNSNSVAPIAVLSSMAMANNASGFHEGFLPLLRTYQFYSLDEQRRYLEGHLLPAGNTRDAWGRIFSNERLEDAKLPHRKDELENFVKRLQFSVHRELVTPVIATLREDIARREWSDSDAARARIFLSRMDASTFKYEPTEGGILLQPTLMHPQDVQIVENAGRSLQQMALIARLHEWGNAAVRDSAEAHQAFGSWKDAYQSALELEAQLGDEENYIHKNLQVSASVAAGLIVQAGSWLDKSQLEWCFRQIEAALLEHADSTASEKQVEPMASHGSRPSASVLPLLLKLYPERTEDVRALLGIAITHAIEQVQQYAALGISHWLWAIDPKLARWCLDATISLGVARRDVIEEIQRQHRREFKASIEGLGDTQRTERPDYNAVEQGLRDSVRSAIAKAEEFPYPMPTGALLHKTFERNLAIVVQMLPSQAVDSELMTFLVQLFREMLENEIERNNDRKHQHPKRFSHLLQEPVLGKVAEWLLTQTPHTTQALREILMDAVARCPEFAAEALDELLHKELNIQSGQRFWKIWIGCARISFANLAFIREHEACRLLSTLLFTQFPGPKEIRRWESLMANTRFVEDAIDAIGGTSYGLRSLCILLDSIAFFMLPEALIRLYRAAKDVPSSTLFAERDSKDCLEMLMRSVVFSMTTRIREHEGLREATLHFLDRLVDSGSPAAYQMRELIVSSLPPAEKHEIP